MRNIGGRLGLSAGSPAAAPTLEVDPATSSVRTSDAGRDALRRNMGAAPAARRRATDAGATALLNGVR